MIRVYEPEELSSGFVGVRVAVSVNGKFIQRFWSRNDISTEAAMPYAKAYERQLLKRRDTINKTKLFSKQTNTGILGLKIILDVCSNKSGEYIYDRITYQHKVGKRYVNKSKTIKDHNITVDDWFEMCLFIKNTRSCKDSVFEKMLTMRPDTKKVAKIVALNRKRRKQNQKQKNALLKSKDVL